jgi:hypothetical protein
LLGRDADLFQKFAHRHVEVFAHQIVPCIAENIDVVTLTLLG